MGSEAVKTWARVVTFFDGWVNKVNIAPLKLGAMAVAMARSNETTSYLIVMASHVVKSSIPSLQVTSHLLN